MGFFSWAFLVFITKESKKRRLKQPGKLTAKSRSQPVSLPGAWPLMNPLQSMKRRHQRIQMTSGISCCTAQKMDDASINNTNMQQNEKWNMFLVREVFQLSLKSNQAINLVLVLLWFEIGLVV